MVTVEFSVRDQKVRTIRKRDSTSLWYRQISQTEESNDFRKIVDLGPVPILNGEPECTVRHDGSQMINAILPVNIDILFKALNSDSRFLQEFNKARKIFDVVHSEWQNDETDGGRLLKSFKYKMTLKPTLGPKYSVVSIYCIFLLKTQMISVGRYQMYYGPGPQKTVYQGEKITVYV